MPITKLCRLALVLIVMTALVAAAHVYAQDEDNNGQAPETEDTQEPEPENDDPEDAEVEEDTLAMVFRESFKDLDKVTGEIEFSKADLELLLKHHESLEDLMADDQEFRTKLRSNLHEGFKHLIGSETYNGWATRHDLDAERYARVTLRIRTTFMKQYFGRHFQSLVDAQRDLVEKYRDELPISEYRAIRHELDLLEESYGRAQAELDKAPGPTDAEKALLAEHKQTLGRLFELPLPDEDAEGEPESDDEDEGESDEKDE